MFNIAALHTQAAMEYTEVPTIRLHSPLVGAHTWAHSAMYQRIEGSCYMFHVYPSEPGDRLRAHQHELGYDRQRIIGCIHNDVI